MAVMPAMVRPQHSLRPRRCVEADPCARDSYGYWITSVTFVEWTRLPLVPVTMMRYVPRAAAFLESSVKVDEPAFTIEDGLNLAVTFFGKPLADSATVPLNPLPAGMVTV